MKKYFNRDLSWLTFNERILTEAEDSSNPLFERIKFLAIYSNNLDEFFRVRVAHIQSLQQLDKEKLNKKLDISPTDLLHKISTIVLKQQERFGINFRESLLPELEKNNISLLRGNEHLDIIKDQSKYIFMTQILAFLNPIVLDAEAPFLENGKLYFFITLQNVQGKITEYGLLNIPSDKINRFAKLISNEKNVYSFIDDIIKAHIDYLFPLHTVVSCYSIKLNRDADLHIEDEYSGDLLEKIKKHLHKRNIGPPSRLLYDNKMPQTELDWIKRHWNLSDDEISIGGRYHNFSDFFSFPNPLSPALEIDAMENLQVIEIDTCISMFDLIEQKDIMLYFPYHTFDYVLRFFNEAAVDPDVKEISLTIYRIAKKSRIGDALITAARNGKKVTCFVELKARFDEENNIEWAANMEKAGVRIIYSIPGLKVHAKVALIKRKRDDITTYFAYFGTGNFNEMTATVYTDFGLFSANNALCSELNEVLHYLVTKKTKPELKHFISGTIQYR